MQRNGAWSEKERETNSDKEKKKVHFGSLFQRNVGCWVVIPQNFGGGWQVRSSKIVRYKEEAVCRWILMKGGGPSDHLYGWHVSQNCSQEALHLLEVENYQTHLLSCPTHHGCPTQPCFHTLTMRVKACTLGCLWATSVTSLSVHTLGLKQEHTGENT